MNGPIHEVPPRAARERSARHRLRAGSRGRQMGNLDAFIGRDPQALRISANTF
jgi:hypothetical protein